MVTLNSHGEVADFVNESQFEGGETAYACVAFSAALIKYAGAPGKGPTGTGEEVDQLADFWYGKEEGSYAASNTNGMSLDAEYMMLRGMGMPFKALAPNVDAVKQAVQDGLPVMMCGAETGMHDLDVGGAVPYSWTPSGNHCIVACGIASDGNLLVRDTASIGSTGVRPGPRRYDAAKLQLISATAILVPWEITTMIAYNTPGVSHFFTETDPQHWHCLQTDKMVQFAILDFYKRFGGTAFCGLTWLGLPMSNEIALVGSQHGAVRQHFEDGVVFYDPAHEFDARPGIDTPVYLAKLYQGQGQDPAIAQLQAELAAAQKPTITGIDPAHVASFQQARAADAQKLRDGAQALATALIVPFQ